MKIAFACPSCGASGSADDSIVGKIVRCKHCTHRFAVAVPGDADVGYAMVEPTRVATGLEATSLDSSPLFVPTRGEEPICVPSPRKPKRTTSESAATRRSGSSFAWQTWLVRLGVFAAIALLATALFAPHGVVVAGSAMLILGSAMVMLGYAAGAYGAFCEDFLYGFLYLVIPLYTAYYLVTRWEDLWRWFACSTTGVGLVLFGTQLLRWSGVGA
jgi:hypothetical protein